MRRLLALLCLVPGLAWADPAVFVARAPGVTIYLLGSIHGLKPGLEWRTPAIGRAFDAAGECWFEAVLNGPNDPAVMAAALRGLDLSGRLPTLLSDEDKERLAARAEALHLPGGANAVRIMRPWLAWATLEAGAMAAAGMDPKLGVDQVLQDEARADGKPVVGLETLDGQIGILASQPEPVILRALHQLLAAPAGSDRELGALQREWLAGRIDVVGHALTAEERKQPALFDALLQRRNQAWAAKLAALRGSGKTILVTVGAAHLAGPGNLRDLLRARHFTVTRVWG